MESSDLLKFRLTPRQSKAFRSLTSDKNADVLYGGAKGGGKSFLLCIWAYLWTQQLIERFGLGESEFPVPVGFIGRKRAVDFGKTTFETWKKVIPHPLYSIRAGEKEIVIDGKAKILYGGLDDQENVNKFNSAELAFIAIDQAEETDQEDIAVLMGSLRLVVNSTVPPYKSLFTANPRHCWLKNRYIRSPEPGTTFIKALPSDNPHLPPNYEDTLKHAFGHNPALLAAYLHGEWDVFEGMFFEEFNRRIHVYSPSKVTLQASWPRFVSVDWGYASPMAVYWHAVAPDRHVYTYREWYRTRILDIDAAREVREITDKHGEKIEYFIGDPQSFPVEIAHHKFGKTVSMKRSDVWAEQGVPLLMGDSKRIPGWSRMRDYMRIRDYRGQQSSWWHISEDCTNLIDEMATAVHDKNKIEDISADSVDHGLESCFPEKTMIYTDRGERPIEEIKVGDMVHTRKGLRKVLVAMATGEKETVGLSLSDGRFLIASTDHPVLCGDVWKPISQLQKGERVWITPTSTAKRGRYGEQQMAIFQRDFTSTTSTEIPGTTTSTTLNSSNEGSISLYTENSSTGEVRNGLNTSQRSDPLRQNPIQTQRNGNGTDCMELINGPQRSLQNAFANNAESNIQHELSDNQSSVLADANKEAQQQQESSKSNESVLSVETNTLGGNITGQKPVPIVAVRVEGLCQGEIATVYNLQVDDCPEYFANGVLVHNCRLFLMSRPPLVIERHERPMTDLEAAERQAERKRREESRRLGMQ